eukprot:14176280-Alexandrium_andersonii.AAC.1
MFCGNGPSHPRAIDAPLEAPAPLAPVGRAGNPGLPNLLGQVTHLVRSPHRRCLLRVLCVRIGREV